MMKNQFKNIESKENQILEPKDQYELLVKYKETKDVKIKDKFLKCYYLFIVKHIYQKYSRLNQDAKLEMMQECMIRISNSIEKYNYEFDNPRPYFMKTIVGACRISFYDHYRKMSNITIPTDLYVASCRVLDNEDVKSSLKTRKGKNNYKNKVINISNFKFLSLDYKKEDGENAIDYLVYEDNKNNSDIDLNYFLGIETISPRERLFLFKKFRDGKTLDEIGTENNISGERVRLIIKNGMNKIKKKLLENSLPELQYFFQKKREKNLDKAKISDMVNKDE